MNNLSGQVIAAAIEVHKALGPGLLESVYQKCLAYELDELQIQHDLERSLPVKYKGLIFEDAYRTDFIIEDRLIAEIKAVEIILPVHKAQLLSYLKLSGIELGLLINFNAPLLKDGITRIINN
jgi:GxxExxY protein